MFDDDLPAPGKGKTSAPLLDDMGVGDLLMLRADIDARLPATKLSQMNLEEELVIQFLTVKELQNDVLNSNEEANKKAQVANTVAATMQQLVKMQTELHTAERLKEIESRLIRCLNKVPEQYLREFFEWYESSESA